MSGAAGDALRASATLRSRRMFAGAKLLRRRCLTGVRAAEAGAYSEPGRPGRQADTAISGPGRSGSPRGNRVECAAGSPRASGRGRPLTRKNSVDRKPASRRRRTRQKKRDVARAHASTDIARLETLAEVNSALAGGSSLRAALQRVMQLLDRRDSVVCGSITLLNPDTGLLHVEASEGLASEGRSARYAIGEGVTGRVVESGKPVIVPRASKEPMFLNRARRKNLDRRDISFICVPIQTGKKSVGAISIDLPFEKGRDYPRYVKFLDVVATMIAQAIRVNHLVDAERQRLTEENVHLRGELQERYDFANIVGTSSPMRQVYGQVSQVAGANTTVLVRGESGTGKELIAHAIHYNSPRAKKPFIKVSCAALPRLADRVRAVRLRARRVHRGPVPQEGAVRAGPGRHPVPGRDRRSEPLDPGQAAPGPAGARVRTPGRHRAGQGRRASDRGHQRRPREGDRRRHVPGGPALPPQRLRHLRAAAPRAEDRRAAAGGPFPGALRRRARQAGEAHLDPRHRHPHGLPLAGNVRRARERHGAGGAGCATGASSTPHDLPPSLQTAEASERS